uniref:Radical SAM domain protein n=1 Tax=uncultured bacterium A1Q1_fos_1000 TaxID=1256536 RepID=L7VVS9_9BACT|nr:radical SAM domain protein [uncultured bacterium A1Q1_fos_1000]
MNHLELRPEEQLKFELLASGIAIDDLAMDHIQVANGERVLTPADYASTSGIILRLDGHVWVNVPIATYNPNFVSAPSFTLTADTEGLRVVGNGFSVAAKFWLPPDYHGRTNSRGDPHSMYAFTHGDRVRVAPITGCAYTCKFCNLPYEFRYRRKDVEGIVEAIETARVDPVQPARHVLISGGTPRPEHYDFLREVYESVIVSFPDIPVDIMMVPIAEVLDVEWLAGLGVHELSINLEVYNDEIAKRLMPHKHRQGRDHLLEFVRHASSVLGSGRIRSMLMVGVEPMEDTLAAVSALVEAGCVPVLSPFRPDPSTPMRDAEPPSGQLLRETYMRAQEITKASGTALGPECGPCSHNTLTLVGPQANAQDEKLYDGPRLV